MNRHVIKYKTIVKRHLSKIAPLNEVWLGRKIAKLRDKIPIEYESGLLSTRYKNREVQFRFSNNYELEILVDLLNEIFANKDYAQLRVKGKSVIDIGANIGDTAIYFALEGARHVYAFEPVPYACTLANENIRLNKLSNKISVINAGAGRSKSINIALNNTIDPGRVLDFSMNVADGVKSIKIYSLDQICKLLKVKRGFVLKVDAEGAEYEILEGRYSNSIRLFDEIIIEYHHGHEKIRELLEHLKYSVAVTKPELRYNYDLGIYQMIGMLYAKKRR